MANILNYKGTLRTTFIFRVREIGLEFAAWDSILRVHRITFRVKVSVRLTLTLILNLLRPLP